MSHDEHAVAMVAKDDNENDGDNKNKGEENLLVGEGLGENATSIVPSGKNAKYRIGDTKAFIRMKNAMAQIRKRNLNYFF